MSGGSLSATILTGFVTDSVMYIPGSSAIYVYIFGDAVAALAGLSIEMHANSQPAEDQLDDYVPIVDGVLDSCGPLPEETP